MGSCASRWFRRGRWRLSSSSERRRTEPRYARTRALRSSTSRRRYAQRACLRPDRHWIDWPHTRSVAAMTTNTPNGAAPDTVVLIHGLWMTSLSWENWAARYQQRGFNVIARSWPGMEGDIDALRADTSAIDDLGIEQILE